MKMEKRTFADQSNSLVDLGKVREASGCIIFSGSGRSLDKVASNVFSTRPLQADAEPCV